MQPTGIRRAVSVNPDGCTFINVRLSVNSSKRPKRKSETPVTSIDSSVQQDRAQRERLQAALNGLGLAREKGLLEGWRGDQAALQPVEPVAIVQPKVGQEVRTAVQWARRHRVALSTFSSGAGRHARGATARVPTVLLDLSGLQRIVHLDERDAVAIVEPGVTFEALDARLAGVGLRAYRPLMPRANKSVIASMLEREPTLAANAHWDVLDPFGAGEIVFGSGELFRTGTASITGTVDEQIGAGVRHLTAYGPATTDFLRVLQGAQGTLGIVTWSAVQCERIPAVERAFFVADESAQRLTQLLAWLHWRRLGNAAFLVNRLQLASLLAPRDVGAAARDDGWPRWAIWVRIGHGGSEFPHEQLECELEELQVQAARLGLKVEEAISGATADDLSRVLQAGSRGLYQDRMLGAHRSVFCLQQLDRVETLLAAADALVAQQGWPTTQLAVYVQPRLHGRNAHIEFILPHAPAETARAQQISDLTAAALQAAGGFFSRPYGAWAPMAYARHLSIQPYLRQTKALLDPDRILNPGRLCF